MRERKIHTTGLSNEENISGELKIPPRKPAWNIWQVLFILLLINILEYSLGWLDTPKDLDTIQGVIRFVSVGFGEGLIYLVVTLLFLRLLKRPVSELGFVSPKFRFIVLGLFTGAFLFVSVGLLGSFLAKLIGIPSPQSFALAVTGTDNLWEFVLLLVLGGIVAPLKEEILFRSLMYPPLREGYGRGKGILLTGMFFAALHLDLLRFIPLFIGGVVLTWLYERSSSLWPSLIAHGTWNVLMAVALWIQR